MKLDEWLTRLVAVPPGRNPLANGIAIGMRIALFILVPGALSPQSRSFFCTDERKQPASQLAIR
jgi:hypothetical protein